MRKVYQAVMLMTVTAVLAGCARETYLTARDGVAIAYEYHQVPEAKGTALLVHGLGTSLDEWYRFSRDLNDGGWDTFAIDLRGHGMSNRWHEEDLDWANFSSEGRLTALRDVDAAIDQLKAVSNLWLIGSSFGSNLAVLTAAERPEVRGVVLFSPGIQMGSRFTPEEASRRNDLRVFIAASGDDPGSPERARQLYEAYPVVDKKLHLTETGGHGSAMLETVPGLTKEVIEWMNQPSR